MKKVLSTVVFFSILFFTSNIIAQDTPEEPSKKLEAAIKMSGISPAVGITYQFGSNSKVRALGFTSVDSRGFNTFDRYILDLSYIRTADWIGSKDVNSYWGVNLHQEFADPKIGPGLFVGSSYYLSEHFAIFGEVALNVFFFDDGDNGEVGMSNSGIGVRVGL